MVIPDWAGTHLLDSVCLEPLSPTAPWLARLATCSRGKLPRLVSYIFPAAFPLLSDPSHRSPTDLPYTPLHPTSSLAGPAGFDCSLRNPPQPPAMREIFGRLRPSLNPTALETEKSETPTGSNDASLENASSHDHSKEAIAHSQPRSVTAQDNDSDDELVHRDAQAGVQKMEATTQVWTRKHLIAAYVM